MTTDHLHVLVGVIAKSASLDDFISLLTHHASRSRCEPGCVRFEVLRNANHNLCFTIHEIWLNQEALESHRHTEHYARWRREMPALQAGERTHEEYTAVCDGKPSAVEVATAIGREARRRGKCVAFTNGCFDVIHPGHVAMLREARQQADTLIVGLNSDASVKALKGPSRPINGVEHRAAVLSALACVDHVVVFDAPTPIDLIHALRPDVLCKGGDWAHKDVAGAAEVKEWGGRFHLCTMRPGHSTTRLIRRLAAATTPP